MRLTTRDHEPDYFPGDAGTVLSGPHFVPSGGEYFVVVMDKSGPDASGSIFIAAEIEVDAAATANT